MHAKLKAISVSVLLFLAVSAGAQTCGPPNYTCFRTDTTATTYPSVPPQAGSNTCTAGNLQNCGNLNGIGTQMSDSRYNNVAYARCTDSSTPLTNQAQNGFFASLAGSGDALEMSTDDTMIRIADSSRGIMMNFNPSTMVCSTMPCGVATGGYCISNFFAPQAGVFSAATPKVYYSFGDNTTFNVQIQQWVVSATGPTSKTLVADMAQALPFAHDSGTDWAPSTTYTAGQYIHPSTGNNNAGGYYYEAIVGGLSGSGTAPAFPQTPFMNGTCNGTQSLPTVTDGAVTWALVGANAVTWFDPAGVSNNDTIFLAGIANWCGQGSGMFAVIYNSTTNIYYLFNTATGFQTHWTCTGGTGPDCTGGSYTETIDGAIESAANGFFIHNDKAGKDGSWEVVAFQRAEVSGSNGVVRFWNPTTPTVTLITGAGTNWGGHWSTRFTDILNVTEDTGGSIWERLLSTPNTTTPEWTGTIINTDGHWSTNFGTAAQTYPIIGSTATTQGEYPPPTAPYQAEVIGGATDGSNTHFRFGQTLATYTSPNFDQQNAIGSLSADGKFFAFTSDWMCTLGSTAGTAADFCGLFWHPSTSYASGIMICPRQPVFQGNNTNASCFTANSSCTSGTSEPTWPQSSGNTVTEASGSPVCTWTNQHVYSARSDVFIMALFQNIPSNVPAPAPWLVGLIDRYLPGFLPELSQLQYWMTL